MRSGWNSDVLPTDSYIVIQCALQMVYGQFLA
jgi:hypothetical protein